MTKLFALEEQGSEGGELLIDKVLAYNKKSRTELTLTADLIQERQKLKKEIEDKLKEDPEDEDGGETSSDEGDKEGEGDSSEEDGGKEASEEEEVKEEKEEKGDGEEASDVDSLKDSMGSGLDDKSEDKPAKKDKEEKEDKPATESYVTKKVRPSNVFAPVREAYAQYRKALSGYSLEAQAQPVTEQPVAYVKEQVLKSLSDLVHLADTYIGKNKTLIEASANGAKGINERFVTWEGMHKAEKVHFTNQLVSDRDIISAVATPKSSSLRDSAAALSSYLNISSSLASKILSNPFEQLSDALRVSGFEADEGGDWVYRKHLPGFWTVRAALSSYTTYVDTKIGDFQIYKVKTVKTQDLYQLASINLDKDLDLLHLFEHSTKALASIGLCVDNLSTVNDRYADFIESLKALAYDIQRGSGANLTQLGLDKLIQNFICFVLVSELYSVDIDISLSFLSSSLKVLDVCCELGS